MVNSESYVPLLVGPLLPIREIPAEDWMKLERLYATPFNSQIKAEIQYICAVRDVLLFEPMCSVSAERFDKNLGAFIDAASNLLRDFREAGAPDHMVGYNAPVFAEDKLDQLGVRLPDLQQLAVDVYNDLASNYVFRKLVGADVWVSWLTQLFASHSLSTSASQDSDKSPEFAPTSPFVHAVALLDPAVKAGGYSFSDREPSWSMAKAINRARAGYERKLSFKDSLEYWEKKCRYRERLKRYRFYELDELLERALSFSRGTG